MSLSCKVGFILPASKLVSDLSSDETFGKGFFHPVLPPIAITACAFYLSIDSKHYYFLLIYH